MTTKSLSKSELAQFGGSETSYRHGVSRNVLYSDGAQHVAEHGGAHWLLDEIAIIPPCRASIKTTFRVCEADAASGLQLFPEVDLASSRTFASASRAKDTRC